MKMTCKDCLHCEVCDYWYKETYPNEPIHDGSICRDFKNKANFVELPYAIGTPVWRLIFWHNSPPEIMEGKVSMIQQKADRSWKIRVSVPKRWTDDFKEEDFGKYVFLSKEAAEATLAEEVNKHD
jgi:hypothetical protein